MKLLTLRAAIKTTFSLAIVSFLLSAVQFDTKPRDLQPPQLEQPVKDSGIEGRQYEGVENGFPETAFQYARMVESELGVPPTVNLDESIEIPLYVKGVQKYGNLGRSCDNPSFLGKDTFSGSMLQRYEGRTADGKPLPEVIWISFARNSSYSHKKVVGSVQMIGYNRKTGATAFFESCDQLEPWVTLDKDTFRMRGTLPGIDNPKEFNRAYETPGDTQCVQCHQADPFITNSFINAAKIPGTDETVVPKLDADAPYYVIGGENWDMRTIHIEGNSCFDCHRVGMSTMTMFMENGWKPDEHMPPYDPGSLREDLRELLDAWKKGPDNVKNAKWIVPPAKGEGPKEVGQDYPHKAFFNKANYSFYQGMFGDKKDSTKTFDPKNRKPAEVQPGEVKKLLNKLEDKATREAFENWFKKNGVDQDALNKLRSMTETDDKQSKKDK